MTKIDGKQEGGNKGGEGSNGGLQDKSGGRGGRGEEGDGMTGEIAGGEEILPMLDGRTNKQGKIELLSQWMLKG